MARDQPKRHPVKFEESQVTPERGLGDVLFSHPYLEVAAAHVHRRVDCASGHLIEDIVNQRQWVLVTDCVGVQSPIVYTEAGFPRFLGHQSDWAGPG